MIAIVFLSGLQSATAAAPTGDDNFAFPETFLFRLSSYRVEDADTTLAVLSDEGIGTAISFREDLGGDDTLTIPRLDMYYRFNERHRIEFSHFKTKRDGNQTLTIEISIEGEEITIGETVISSIDYEMYRLGYAYSFYHSDTVELSLSTGLNFTTYEFEYRTADNRTGGSSDASAPLPMFGLSMGYAINQNWSVHYLSETFFIELGDDLKGALLNYELSVQYRFLKHYLLGLGLTRLSTDLSAKDDDWAGRIDDSHNGILLFAGFTL